MGVNLKQGADATIRAENDLDNLEMFRAGGPTQASLVAANTSSFNYRMDTWIHQKAAVSNATAGTFSIPNPLGVTCVITECMFYLRTGSSVTTTLDIGVGASASATSDVLLDGVSIGANSVPAADVFNTAKDGGTNGRTPQLWGPTASVVGKADATATSFVGDLYIAYFPL